MAGSDPIASPETASEQASAASGADDIDALLNDPVFANAQDRLPSGSDGSSKTAKGLTDVLRQTTEATQRLSEMQRAASKSIFDDRNFMDMALKLDSLSAYTNTAMQRLHEQEQQRVEAGDSAAVLQEARNRLSGMDLPNGWIERWLLSEYAVNREVAEAWHGRYSSEEATRRAVSVLEQTFKRMVLDARAMPSAIDHEATNDRLMVAAAVRGSTSPPPRESQSAFDRRVARMSNAELRKFTDENFGYSPDI